MPNKKNGTGLKTKHTAIEHRHHGPRRAKLDRTKQLIDHYRSNCSDWEDSADEVTEDTAPPLAAQAPAPAPAFEFTNFTELIQFLKKCSIKYISTITKGKLKFEMNEITITITKNSVKRHASEHERFKVTFAVCMEETHKLPNETQEFFESTHCNTPIKMITNNNLMSRLVRIYSLTVDGFGQDIYIASDTAINNFLLKMKSFEDNKKQFALPAQVDSADQDNKSPITLEYCLDNIMNDDDILLPVTPENEFTELSKLWD